MHKHICIYLYLYIQMYACMYVRTYVCICMHEFYAYVYKHYAYLAIYMGLCTDVSHISTCVLVECASSICSYSFLGRMTSVLLHVRANHKCKVLGRMLAKEGSSIHALPPCLA